MLGHKASLKKFKKTEIMSSIFTDHSAMKLEINQEETEKYTKTWKLNNMILHNEWVNNEIKEEIKRYRETKENEGTTIHNLWDAGEAILRGKFTALQVYLKNKKKLK